MFYISHLHFFCFKETSLSILSPTKEQLLHQNRNSHYFATFSPNIIHLSFFWRPNTERKALTFPCKRSYYALAITLCNYWKTIFIYFSRCISFKTNLLKSNERLITASIIIRIFIVFFGCSNQTRKRYFMYFCNFNLSIKNEALPMNDIAIAL